MIGPGMQGSDRVQNTCAGIAFVGGFSYADVLDSGKGWAGAIRWNKRLEQQFAAFRQRC